MRKIGQSLLFLAFLAVALPMQADAQNSMIGVKAGFNSSNISIDDDDDEVETSAGSGLVAGIFVQLGLGDAFAIRPEGLYSQKGFTADLGGQDADLSVNYIEIPVLLVYRFGSEGSVRPNLFAGPVLSFESSCNASTSGTVSFDVDCSEIPGEAIETESTDFGAAVGAGLEIPLGGGNVSIVADGRYTFGFTDVTGDDEGSAKNRAWSFMGGLGIGIG